MCEQELKKANSQSVHVHSSDIIIRIDTSKTASSRSSPIQDELDTMDSLHPADFFGYFYVGCAITSQNAG